MLEIVILSKNKYLQTPHPTHLYNEMKVLSQQLFIGIQGHNRCIENTLESNVQFLIK